MKSNAKLTINYLVTYQCTAPPQKDITDTTAGDYQYAATVFHSALPGGAVDSHPEDDTCPHDALATQGNRDPSPDGRIVDKGCGAKKPGNTFGNPILTNVIKK